MSAMMDAIKQKRGGAPALAIEAAPTDDGGGDQNQDLKALVASLSDDQKSQLMDMLSQDAGDETSASDIEKGAPSDEEHSKIAAKMADDSAEDDGDDDSSEMDEIGKSMLSSSDIAQAGNGRQPRNLGERVRMNLAEKLKAKGKI
jgi:hypothetical protein